jgi:dephospho-CoA kinase
MILGVVGPLGAGKSTAVEYFVSKGYSFYRFSDVIKEIGQLIEPTRSQLQDTANSFRKKHGTDYLATQIWKKIKKSKQEKVVIDGFRNVGEVDFFRNKKDFHLISVDTSQKSRFERLKKRGSSKDPKAWEEFLKMDRRDLSENKAFGQQNMKVMALADIKIKNDGKMSDFHTKVDLILKKISG